LKFSKEFIVLKKTDFYIRNLYLKFTEYFSLMVPGGWSRTLNLKTMRLVFYHCADATGHDVTRENLLKGKDQYN
jgi:hypothetical protein